MSRYRTLEALIAAAYKIERSSIDEMSANTTAQERELLGEMIGAIGNCLGSLEALNNKRYNYDKRKP